MTHHAQRSHSRKTLTSALALAALIAAFSPQPVLSSPDSEFKDGLKDYQSRNFRQALTHFEEALAQGNGSAECYLYIANSQTALGNKGEAIRKFRDVARIFKGLPAEITARKALQTLDPHNSLLTRLPKQLPINLRKRTNTSSTDYCY